MLGKYTAVIVKSDRWYAGFIKEVPGAHSQGRTKKEVLENLKEAVKMVLDSNYSHSIEGFEKVSEETISVNV